MAARCLAAGCTGGRAHSIPLGVITGAIDSSILSAVHDTLGHRQRKHAPGQQANTKCDHAGTHAVRLILQPAQEVRAGEASKVCDRTGKRNTRCRRCAFKKC
jgi:6-phosphofructokinase